MTANVPLEALLGERVRHLSTEEIERYEQTLAAVRAGVSSVRVVEYRAVALMYGRSLVLVDLDPEGSGYGMTYLLELDVTGETELVAPPTLSPAAE